VTGVEEGAEDDGVEVDGLQEVGEEGTLYTQHIPPTPKRRGLRNCT
jgi:hypothetical protein